MNDKKVIAHGDIVPPVWISELCGPEVGDLSYGQGFRNGFNECRDVVLKALAAHPPADAAPIDVEQAARSKWTVKQWYEHVGAWENPQGEVCFGSVMALGAMLKLMAKARHAAQSAPLRDDALDAARWQFMVEVSAGPPAHNTYAAALNEQHFFLHGAPQRRKAAFIAAVDKARQQIADQQSKGGAK